MSLCAASSAAAARTEFFGIVQGHLDSQDLQGMAASGIRTTRFELGWRSVEPSQGSYRWAASDRFVGALAAHGIRPMPFVWMSPRWVASSPARPPIDTAGHVQAWQNFLKAAVARYGPSGSYWTNGYVQRYGAGATPRPIQSWQVWNEPNLKKYFDPEGSDEQTARKYARLLRVSHAAITAKDPQAQVVLAGNPGYPPSGGMRAWGFLDRLYREGGIKSKFDVAALHPYSQNVDGLRIQVQNMRAVMKKHGDGATPLWLTELGWGSAPPDRFGINQGPTGQQQLLNGAYKLILNHRNAWNVQRLFWFLWRDPKAGSPFARRCSFCGSAGLLRHDRSRKPAHPTFRSFTAETNPPGITLTAAPTTGSSTNDSTPRFSFASGDLSASFECRRDAGPFESCSSPHTVSELSDGTHNFYVRAIDAPGNESPVRWRSFTVDTTVPAVTISGGPGEGQISSDQTPTFGFSSNESGASLRCQLDSGGFQACSSPFTASSLPDGTHTFRVRATDAAQNTGAAARTWTVDTTEPTVTISSGPGEGSASPDRTPSFGFGSGEPDVRYECRLGGGAYRACSSPFTTRVVLADGSYRFQVMGTDAAGNFDVATRTWTVDGPADVSITAGPASGSALRNATPSFGFSSLDADSSFSCRMDSAAFAPCSSPFTTSALSDGMHTFRVMATDPAQGTDVAWRSFRVDTTDPRVRIKGRGKVRIRRRKGSARFVLKASERVGRRCRIDSRRFKPCSARYRSPKLRTGRHTLKVKAVDRAGNVGAKRKTFKVVRR
jgi:hypothetical protein